MPRLLSPTILVAEWKIAVNLAATQSIQNQPGVPAYNCQCEWCKNWAASASSVLPDELQSQLERLGMKISSPNDLYAYQEAENGAYCRVIFHIVGKILSGPEVWREDNVLGEMLVYRELLSTSYLSLAIYPPHLKGGPSPIFNDRDAGKLLQIDFRLFVPNAKATCHA